jgi:hypothetical protein
MLDPKAKLGSIARATTRYGLECSNQGFGFAFSPSSTSSTRPFAAFAYHSGHGLSQRQSSWLECAPSICSVSAVSDFTFAQTTPCEIPKHIIISRRPRDGYGGHFFALDLAFAGGGAAASRSSRSALRRSRFFENAFCAISCSVIAFSASTWRKALRASRSALLIGFCGSTSPGVFVIS